MPQFSTDDMEAFKAFEKLNSEARQTGAAYRDTIAKSCITVISAIIAIIGFLINAHQTKLLFRPINSEWTLFMIFAGFGLSYAMAIISTKHYANYLSGHSESIRHKGLSDDNESTKQKKLRDKAGNKLKFVARASEISAIIGIIGLLSFGIILVRNIDSNYNTTKSVSSAKKQSSKS